MTSQDNTCGHSIWHSSKIIGFRICFHSNGFSTWWPTQTQKPFVNDNPDIATNSNNAYNHFLWLSFDVACFFVHWLIRWSPIRVLRASDLSWWILARGEDLTVHERGKFQVYWDTGMGYKLGRSGDAVRDILISTELRSVLYLTVPKWAVNDFLSAKCYLKCKKMKKSLALTSVHTEARLSWTEQYVNWTSEWRSVIFSGK